MGQKKYHALILDDEVFLGNVLTQNLLQRGFEAYAVTKVDSAIQELNQKHYDIVISDIYMPDKNGEDLFNYCLENFPDLPIIFMTGNPDLEMAVEFLKKGGYDYIAKPFLMDDFFNKIDHVLEKAHKRKQEKYLVSDLRQLLNDRLEELQIFKDIIESTDDGLIILDTEGIIVEVNPGFERMSGMRKSEILQKNVLVLQKDLLPNLNFSEIKNILAIKGQWEQEMRGSRATGDIIISSSSFFPIRNEIGNIFAYSSLIKDVSKLRGVESALIESLENTTLAQEAIIFGLAKLAEFRDKDTGYHLERIRGYSKILAEELSGSPKFQKEIDEKFIDTIYRTAPLHDIGKVGIPDRILLKNGSLTAEEYEIIKSHTTIGYQTLSSIRQQYGEMDFLNMGIDITYCHHERWDGKGYPRGMKENEIPLSAKIVAIADVYDALTTDRTYKNAFSHEKSLEIMSLERGKHFAPIIFDVFLSISDHFNKIRKKYSSDYLKNYPSQPKMLSN
jgi:PAS domain S-box-containing protein